MKFTLAYMNMYILPHFLTPNILSLCWYQFLYPISRLQNSMRYEYHAIVRENGS